MKWYKHISDSLDDPFIFDLISKFGGDGYLVFFGVLEIYSREFKTELGWNLKVTRAYLRQKLQKRQDTLIINCLKHIRNSGKWNIDFIEDQVIIFIPKFTEFMDEWTARKLGSKSGVTPKILIHDKEEDKDTDKDINKEWVVSGVKKKKEKKPFIPPTLEEAKAFFREKGYKESVAERAWMGYDVADWHNSQKKKISNWKQTFIQVWFKDENKEIKRQPEYKQPTLEEQIS